jgi:hypothetical protein
MRTYDQAPAPDYWSEVQLRASSAPGDARPERSARPALLLVAALLLLLTISAAVAVGSGVVELPWFDESPTPSTEPSVRGGWPPAVWGWPSTGPNRPGVYSWDGSNCAPAYCGVSATGGFMHNGYGSGDVDIILEVVPHVASSDRDGTTVTVAGHDGIYRRVDGQQEEWVVNIEGTGIVIRLTAEPGTSQLDLADAHAIIDSMRTEPRANNFGFRLLFTLTNGEWDSG